ncbi:soluble calcium-activated nucleotidase 1-like [Mytilus edulis]|uniref:soluble calcium-activated nucleotidase 1-like n=1 Tax=Mytilus edulis TaxID=6550 RepID=UPI0039EF0972
MLSSPSTVHDWMQAIRRPTPYRVGNAKLHLKTRTVAYFMLFFVAFLILIVNILPQNSSKEKCDCSVEYDNRYPLSKPYITDYGLTYKIAMVTDLDTESKSKKKANTWLSYLQTGNLTLSSDHSKVTVKLDKIPVTLSSSLSQGGRGMELSELVVYNGNLYSVDDRTGIIYFIKNNAVYPWVLLVDGNGTSHKGFKCEWATVKHGRLYVGGLGKEWTSAEGIVLNTNPQWVKSIGPKGDVEHIDWKHIYNKIRKVSGYSYPGYMIHESGMWSDVHQRWFFLPRRASQQSYDETADESRATNILLSANEDFTDVDFKFIGKKQVTKGYSSFRFIPWTDDKLIVALKSQEVAGKLSSYLTVFTLSGEILLPDMKIGDVKYEGIEFI